MIDLFVAFLSVRLPVQSISHACSERPFCSPYGQHEHTFVSYAGPYHDEGCNGGDFDGGMQVQIQLSFPSPTPLSVHTTFSARPMHATSQPASCMLCDCCAFLRCCMRVVTAAGCASSGSCIELHLLTSLFCFSKQPVARRDLGSTLDRFMECKSNDFPTARH